MLNFISVLSSLVPYSVRVGSRLSFTLGLKMSFSKQGKQIEHYFLRQKWKWYLPQENVVLRFLKMRITSVLQHLWVVVSLVFSLELDSFSWSFIEPRTVLYENARHSWHLFSGMQLHTIIHCTMTHFLFLTAPEIS